jgi:hypothetical protein
MGEDDENDDGEDKYTEDYIKYALEHKYYESDKHLRNTENDVFYLTAGNLPDNTTKKDILTYLDSKGIEIKQITIIMTKQGGLSAAQMEIYKRGTAINTLKLCGDSYGEKQMIIEVDEKNEKHFCGGSGDYYQEEVEDPHQELYTKYDTLPDPLLNQNENQPASAPSGTDIGAEPSTSTEVEADATDGAKVSKDAE